MDEWTPLLCLVLTAKAGLGLALIEILQCALTRKNSR